MKRYFLSPYDEIPLPASNEIQENITWEEELENFSKKYRKAILQLEKEIGTFPDYKEELTTLMADIIPNVLIFSSNYIESIQFIGKHSYHLTTKYSKNLYEWNIITNQITLIIE